MNRYRLLLTALDVAITIAAVAIVRVAWDGAACYVAMSVLAVRALVVSRGVSGRFCQSLAASFVLTYMFRRAGAIEIASSVRWLFCWTATLVVVIEGARDISSPGLSGLLVGSAVLLMLPPADTTLIRQGIPLWCFVAILVITAYTVATLGSRIVPHDWSVTAYLVSPALIFLPVILLAPLLLSVGVPVMGFITFWVKCFVLSGGVAALLVVLQRRIMLRKEGLN